MDSNVKNNLSSIQKLLTTYKVERAYLFGSAAKNTMQPNSDIDILIHFSSKLNEIEYGNNYVELMYALQSLLNKEVDLVAEETVTNPYLLQSINKDKISIL